MTPISNYRLEKKDKLFLKSLGFGNETRGLRAALELIEMTIGIKEAIKLVRIGQLGLKTEE